MEDQTTTAQAVADKAIAMFEEVRGYAINSSNGGTANCVEAGPVPGAVLIRDTKDGGRGPVLRVPRRRGAGSRKPCASLSESWPGEWPMRTGGGRRLR